MSAGAERLQDTVNCMVDQMILKGEMATLKKDSLHMVEYNASCARIVDAFAGLYAECRTSDFYIETSL